MQSKNNNFPIETIPIKTTFIKLDAFLKFSGACGTGGEAKIVIQEQNVLVNNEICTQRGKKLRDCDIVIFNGICYHIHAPQEDIF